MRKEAVVLKVNNSALILNLDPDMTFEEIYRGVEEKFRSTGRFFKNAQLLLSFRGRELSDEEELALVNLIVFYAKIEIISIVDENMERQEHYHKILKEALREKDEDGRFFYKGTLKKGEKIESGQSIVILGDVNPGATVVSNGNIIVLGCAMGTLQAGTSGNRNAFVAALTLKPYLLSIAEMSYRSAIVKKEDTGEYAVDPKIAFITADGLSFKPISKEAYEEYFSL